MDTAALDDKAVQTMLSHATEIGTNNGIDMDFSETSIKKLDEMLTSFHEEIAKDPNPDQEALSGIAISLGIYIGEVMRRNADLPGLVWRYGTPQTGGAPTAYLFSDGNEVYPVDWVAKQLTAGAKESVWKKFEHFNKKLAQ